MTMAYGERMLRETGDPADQVYAGILEYIRTRRGDIPLPEAGTSTAEEDRSTEEKQRTLGSGALARPLYTWGDGVPRLPDATRSEEVPTTDEIGRRMDVALGLQELAQPYIEACLRVPSESKRKRKKPSPTTWNVQSSQLGEADRTYVYTLGYERENQPSFLEVGVHEVSSNDLTIRLGVNNNVAVDTIHVKARYDPQFNPLDHLVDNQAGLIQYLPEPGFRSILYMDISLDYGNLRAGVLCRDGYGGDTGVTYEYDSKEDRFACKRVEDRRRTVVDPRSVEEYKRFVAGVLNLIPLES